MGDGQAIPINEMVSWLHAFAPETLSQLSREFEADNEPQTLLEPGIICGNVAEQNMRARLRVARATVRDISVASGKLLAVRITARRKAARLGLASRVVATISASTLLGLFATTTPLWGYIVAGLTLASSLLGLLSDFWSPASAAGSIASAAALKAQSDEVARRATMVTADQPEAHEVVGRANELALAATREMAGV